MPNQAFKPTLQKRLQRGLTLALGVKDIKTTMSLTKRRVIAGVMLAVGLVCLANFYFDFGLFGSWAKNVMVISFLLMGLSQVFFGISVEELRAYRDSKRAKKGS